MPTIVPVILGYPIYAKTAEATINKVIRKHPNCCPRFTLAVSSDMILFSQSKRCCCSFSAIDIILSAEPFNTSSYPLSVSGCGIGPLKLET